jgi:CRISPR/Cas system-associated exonuclease Cas4 (RecB family)
MFDFDRLVDNHIAREHHPKKVGRYYPSEIGGCLRKTFYSYKYPKEIDADLRKIFEAGNIIHGFVVEVLKSERNKDIELLKSEMPFSIDAGDFTISGRVDDLILIKQSGKEVLVEVKSTKDVAYVKGPATSHVTQLMFYMEATGVHNGVVLYVGRGDLKSKAFEVKFDAHKCAEIFDRFGFLHHHLKSDELPQDEAKRIEDMKWMCGYCEYKDKCKKNEK